MNKIMILAMLSMVSGLAYASSTPGSFGEVASSSPCHCLMFNSTANTLAWVLVNNFNYSLSFNVIEPQLDNTSITLSVMNGTIAPYADYQINVSVATNAAVNESGYITAYAKAAGGNSTGVGGQIQLGASKFMEIISGSAITPSLYVSPASQSTTTLQSTSTTPSSGSPTSSVTSSSQQTQQSSSASSGTMQTIIAFIVGVVVVVAVIAAYQMLKRRGKSEPS